MPGLWHEVISDGQDVSEAVVSGGDLEAVRAEVAEGRRVLGALRAERGGAWENFEHALDLELTFTSNAIEGNTLTAVETTLVVEKGLTIGGKLLRDHLEAIDHFEALGYVRRLARERRAIGELDVRNLHRLVLLRSAPEIAGRYADQGRYVLTGAGRQAFPSPAEVPALMGGFAGWLGGVGDEPDAAFSAHLRLVQIHPFNDGNGRVARLLMNLMLLRGGYVPVVVRPEDRVGYLEALAAAGEDDGAFRLLLWRRLAVGLGEAIGAV